MNRKAILTVEMLDGERCAVKVNGNLLAECKNYADAEDFIAQWELGARGFKSGYEIRRQPIPAVRKRQPLRRTAAGKLLQDDALAAETYAIAAVRALLDRHGWSSEQVRQLCEYAIAEDYRALEERRHLPPLREAPFNPFNLRRFFE
ncbi:hypothetical protein [Synechococcus sp. PCC 7336]|uniref:hypothetical protein n=1 Tax=Synechococcus sp. PCC 7336 TaxID=195250 RepID=UPI00034B833D|nr:hypothetical protein [Synechococcus sp. PCC 7336]